MADNAMGNIRSRKNTDQLLFDFRFRGVRCREQTLLNDTAANRKKLQAILNRIDREIKQGVFNYRDYFPDSKLANQFDHAESHFEQPTKGLPSFGEFSQQWYEENEIRWKDSYKTVIKGTLKQYLIPEFNRQQVDHIRKADILKFRASLSKGNHPATKKRALSNDRVNHIMTPLRMILDDAADRFEFQCGFKGIKTLKAEATDVEPFYA